MISKWFIGGSNDFTNEVIIWKDGQSQTQSSPYKIWASLSKLLQAGGWASRWDKMMTMSDMD